MTPQLSRLLSMLWVVMGEGSKNAGTEMSAEDAAAACSAWAGLGAAARLLVGWSLRLSLAISVSPVPAAVRSSESCQGHIGQYPEVRMGWIHCPHSAPPESHVSCRACSSLIIP